MQLQDRFDVAIVGAGAIGASTALALARKGASVVVLEQGAGWAAGCSRGNAGLICPSHAGHYAGARDLTMAARWVLRRDSPFAVRPTPALVPFGMRLALAMRSRHQRRVGNALRDLAVQGLGAHASLAASGLRTGFAQRGLIDVYETGSGLRGGVKALGAHTRSSVALSRSEIAALEPALCGPYAGGVLHPDEAHCDPAAYVEAVGGAAVALGAAFMPATKVLGLCRDGDAVTVTTTGATMRVDTVVVAAGAASAGFARAGGRRLALQPGKGYSLEVRQPVDTALQRPVMLQEARVAVTPFGGRLRLAGTLELTGADLRIDERRVRAIRRAGERALPGAGESGESTAWAGLRPCSADGLHRMAVPPASDRDLDRSRDARPDARSVDGAADRGPAGGPPEPAAARVRPAARRLLSGKRSGIRRMRRPERRLARRCRRAQSSPA